MRLEEPWDDDDTVCFCTGLTVADIRKAIEDGADTVEKIGIATGAGTHCGGCTKDAQLQLLEAYAKK